MSKITKKELKQIQELQGKLNKIYANIANLEILKTKVIKEHDETDIQMQELTKELEEKYGKVNISLSDGEISEIEE